MDTAYWIGITLAVVIVFLLATVGLLVRGPTNQLIAGVLVVAAAIMLTILLMRNLSGRHAVGMGDKLTRVLGAKRKVP